MLWLLDLVSHKKQADGGGEKERPRGKDEEK